MPGSSARSTAGLAGRLLGVRVAPPPPLRRQPGALGRTRAVLADPVGWRGCAYLLLKLPALGARRDHRGLPADLRAALPGLSDLVGDPAGPVDAVGRTGAAALQAAVRRWRDSGAAPGIAN
ncbi:MAG: sensor domain-containing protein [Streptosporangiaceae bacterium]